MDLYKELEKVFPAMLELFSENTLAQFKKSSPFGRRNFFFLNEWIKTHLLGSDQSIYRAHFSSQGINRTEDMTAIVISLFHHYLR
jgi:hemerythrin